MKCNLRRYWHNEWVIARKCHCSNDGEAMQEKDLAQKKEWYPVTIDLISCWQMKARQIIEIGYQGKLHTQIVFSVVKHTLNNVLRCVGYMSNEHFIFRQPAQFFMEFYQF
jgi:hypothetical protein